MSPRGPDAQDLLDALLRIRIVLDAKKPLPLSELPSLRLKVMKPLNAYIRNLEQYCRQLEQGTAPDKKLSKDIQIDVKAVRTIVSNHVAKWTPATVANDQDGYKQASASLQRSLLMITKYGNLQSDKSAVGPR